LFKLPKLIKYASILLVLWVASASAAEPLTFFRIGTGPSTETLYRFGTAISAGISRPPGGSPCDEGGICGVPGLIAVTQSKSGSLENIKAIRDGQLESALVSADMAFWAYVGRGPFQEDGAFDDLRVITNLTPVKAHIIVRKDSSYQLVNDLKNARVSIGQADTGESYTAKIMLRAHKLELDKMSLVNMRPGPASDAITNSTIDAMILFGTDPVSVISDLTRNTDIRILPFTNVTIRKVQNLYPFIRRSDILANTYQNVPPTKTFQLGVQWIVHKNADPELIAAITKAFWQGQTEEIFKNDNPNITFPGKDYAVPYGWGAPLHSGAKNYYSEIDIFKE